MILKNVSNRVAQFRDTSGTNYIVQPGQDLIVPEALWADSAFRKSYSYRTRDVIVFPSRALYALTWSTSITPDASLASPSATLKYTVTAGTAFTMNAPTSPSGGAELTFIFNNTSGGAMGTITWNAIYKLDGTFTGPTNGNHKSIAFIYDQHSALWREISRSG